jgi:hypothetical protein
MTLEQAGGNSLNKLIKTIKERYPDYNFDVPPAPDRKHKAPYLCKDNKIFYEDMEGNIFCGCRYKKQDEVNPYKWDWSVCHALVTSANEKNIKTNNQKEMF